MLIFIIFLVTFINKITSVHDCNIQNYTDMIDHVLGKRIKHIVGVMMCCELYLYVILFFIFAGQVLYYSGFLDMILPFLNILDIGVSTGNATIIMVVIILPTMYLKYVQLNIIFIYIWYQI